ncbi:MAG: T9SS type A sorting domain-containing protein [Candidatus Krumholzibacteriota bacterium]|nr:T9SS type A sorting domain-containing protein [Candidatus Krumholzibacteriota bacterium]
MASVYAYVGIYNGGVPAGYSGDQILDDPRYEVVDSLTAPDGGEWFIVQMDTAFSPAGGVVRDRFAIDLHDSRFVGGDEIRYFIAAQSADGPGSWAYYFDAEHATDLSLTAAGFAVGTSSDINVAFANYQEVTVLPSGNPQVDILYVDAASGRRVQPYYDTAFDQLGIVVDRFDVGESGSSAGGNFGHRVADVFAQLIPSYRNIIWDSEDLTALTIGDGTSATTGTGNSKTDDWAILFPFIDQHNNLPGLYLAGNSLGAEWFSQTGQAAVDMKSVYMNFGLSTNDHQTLVGMPLNPLAIGQAGGIFDHILGPDTVVAFGGCPIIRQLDVYTQTGGSVVAMAYGNDQTRVAILNQTTTNAVGQSAQVVLQGFSMRFLRDDVPSGVADRVRHLQDVLTYMQTPNTVPTGTGGNPGLRNSLSQNYPNPFNPTTTIDYSLRDRSQVSLKIYNVAGQLVRTLINEVKVSGAHTVAWDGRNGAGQNVASGVYFYKLTSKNFVQTRKMVLLK